MSAQLTRLIEGFDNFEKIREQIAAILVVEAAQQQALALAQSHDPNLWKLRVYLERSNPWEGFESDDRENVPEDRSPIINVSFDNTSFDQSSSNVVERQRGTGTYHIDCYGVGLSGDKIGGGHVPGDEMATAEAHRAFRLVRRILMAGAYTYLGFPQQRYLPEGQSQIVWRRWPRDVQVFQPQAGERPVAHVVGARFALLVDFNEFSPQVEGQLLEQLSLVCTDPITGQVVLAATFEYPTDEES